jgi:hypothetical protein
MRENRFIAGVNTLQDLGAKLRQNVLLIKDKVAEGATFEDAKKLAGYAGLARGPNGFNDFVQRAMGCRKCK